jgi:hypothetical protein
MRPEASPPTSKQGVRASLFDPEPSLRWPENADGWMVEELDWGVRPTNQAAASTPVDGLALAPRGGCRRGAADGGLHGGAGLAARHPLVPELDGRVLAIETSEEAPPPVAVTYFLRTLAATGELSRLAALLVGRPGGASLPIEDHQRYDEAVLAVVRDEQQLNLPVVTGLDFGHTAPVWTLPIGLPVRVDVDQRAITVLEPATARR